MDFREWEKFLNRIRTKLLQCKSARIDIGIMADCQVADFDLRVPVRVLQSFAKAKVWLGLTLMPNGNNQVRYQQKYYNTLSADTPSLERPMNFRQMPPPLPSANIRGNGGASADVFPVFMETLSDRNAELRLHINMPQRRGGRLNCILG